MFACALCDLDELIVCGENRIEISEPLVMQLEVSLCPFYYM